ncbi:MAG TPA: antitoxin MazE-like protein [Terriglobales bacterium]|jgi:hypothetical protein
MATAAERMKALRHRRRAQGLRELRLLVPDARLPAVRRRIARHVAALDRADEERSMRWIEAVSEFDQPDPS